ncbi:MAG: hypothetical protein RM021_003770 [Nostoc sp. EkiNYC01]|nr:hypothetical protein [Nostoc sp. EkiNYC01]
MVLRGVDMYLLQNWQIGDFLVIKLLQLQEWVSEGARLTQLGASQFCQKVQD